MAMLSFGGIDVSKDRLDVILLPEEKCASVSNDAGGWTKLVEQLRGDAILFASNPEKLLDSDALVADAVLRPRVPWIGLAANGQRNTATYGEKKFEFTIASNEATDYSGFLLTTMECWHERHRQPPQSF
jgi:hypothetical protein